MEENEITDDSSYYAVLNVPNEASEEDIRRSYRQLAQVFHPDKAQQGSDDAANFMRIQEAYEVRQSLILSRTSQFMETFAQVLKL